MSTADLSVYVPMRDGVALAVDVHLPAHRDGPVPAVIQFTRYWRGFDWASPPSFDPRAHREAEAFTARRHAYVAVDCRGSGASFGCRPTEYAPDEVADFGEMIGWVADQEWCDGNVTATGLSYAGNCAELAALSGRAELRAIAPRFADFDWFEHILFPGGARNIAFAREWSALVSALDRGDPAPLNAAKPKHLPKILGVGRAREDETGDLRAQAIGGHQDNADFWEIVSACEFRDDIAAGKAPANLADLLPESRYRVPAMVWAGWMDAGTAAGALARFRSVPGPVEVVIGPWNHGAVLECDPLRRDATPIEAQRGRQIDAITRFFKRRPTDRRIVYYVMGEGKWRTSRRWPPRGVKMRRFHLGPDGALSPDAQEQGADRHRVDPAAGSGSTTRWTTSLGGGPVEYRDREAADRRLIVYESAPLEADVTLIGDPQVALWVRSTASDGLFIAYLEAVLPDRSVAYLSEGVLRAVHRRTPRRFRREDALPLVPGEPALLQFPILPLAARMSRGTRIRLAIAGADADTFEPLPGEAASPVVEILRGPATPSHLDLPFA